ncbi:MAG TPA: TetR/AcrR family transcriptional regulator [Desulfomonilaceae bacterium]|nr:TetR/AcrR family transcriptional regulator [Desulfomonilaceae bacterium]
MTDNLSTRPQSIESKEYIREDSVRQRIISRARQQFFALGFRSVTMDDIAKELGMSKKTLYAHFPSKAALLEAVFLNKFHEVEGELEQITSECSSDFLASMRQLLACVQRHMEELQPPFMRDMRRWGMQIFELVESRRKDLIHHYFGKLLVEGRRAGIIRKDVPTKIVIEVLFGAIQAIMNPGKLAELGIAPKTGFSAINEVVFKGVMTEKGRSKL